MPITVHQFPCLTDNYGFLIRDEATGEAAAVDAPDGEAVLREADRLGWKIKLILNTHWHPDHTGGNAVIKAQTGAHVVGPQEVERISPVDKIVVDGDRVQLGETVLEVIATGGHTLQHISYYDAADAIAFVGDTLFALGCGRLFEGTPEQMFASLRRLDALPPATQVYCAHEYTATNARFALTVDPRPELADRAAAVFAARERGEATVPTTIGLEQATNPFLRAPTPAAFAGLRAGKDAFKG